MKKLMLAGAWVVAVISVAAAQGTGGAKNAGQPLKWGPAPAVFPAGAKMAVLAGDPGKAEEFTVRLDMPAGYTIKPHWHPTDEHITVIKGTFLVGMSDTVNAKQTLALNVGDFATAMANQHHYGIARGRTIVQVHAIGPFALTYVNPKDDPSKIASK